MKFVLRDDDTCAFTTPSDLISCYQEVWQSVPVNVSVTPFRVPGSYHFVPDQYYGARTPLSIESNHELVSFLKEKIKNGCIDIALHGYHHDVYDGKPEYVAGERLLEKTIHAKQYLSALLGTEVNTFVPPHNSIGKSGLDGVIAAGLNLVNIPSLWSLKVRKPELRTYLNMPKVYWHTKLQSRLYPHILNFKNHKEISYHTAGPSSIRQQLINELDYCHEQNGVFILATHYHSFEKISKSGQTIRTLVHDLINHATSKPGTSFVRINDIWK